MRLLFDQNLSAKLCQRLADLHPNSSQARLLGMDRHSDRDLWRYAADHDYAIVTQDSDFAELAALYGPPPKIIWLRCGNAPTNAVERLIRGHASVIATFEQDPSASCLELW